MQIEKNINQAIRYWKNKHTGAESQSVQLIISELEKSKEAIEELKDELIRQKEEELRLSAVVISSQSTFASMRTACEAIRKELELTEHRVARFRESIIFLKQIEPKAKRQCRKYSAWNQYCAGYSKATDIMIGELKHDTSSMGKERK